MENVKTIKINEAVMGDTNYFAKDISVIDIRHGGQFGFLPVIGSVENGKAVHSYLHETSYFRNDLIPIVLETPKMFKLLPNSKYWEQSIKAFIEVHAKTIEGLDASLSVDQEEGELGFSGGVFKEPTNVTRAGSDVTVGGISERDGTPFTTLLDIWIRYGIMDPDVKVPLINRIVSDPSLLPDVWDASWYSCTVAFIEPDTFLRGTVKGWIVSNLFPTSGVETIGGKDKSTGGSKTEISINLGGVALPPTNTHVQELCDKLLNELQLWTINPETDILLPTDGVQASLKDVKDLDIYYEGKK